MKISVVLCILLLFAGSAECLHPNLGKGMREISVQGFWDPEGAYGTEFDLTGAYGLFIADKLEIGALASYAYYGDSDEGAALRIWFMGGFFEYNLDLGMLTVPYAGFETGYASYSAGGGLYGGAVVYGPKAGMKYFLSDNVAVDFAFKFMMANDDIFVKRGGYDNSKIYAVFGIRALF